MATIIREAVIDAPAAPCWDAVRDFSALHERLARGFVTAVTMAGERERQVTFFAGAVATETLVGIDDQASALRTLTTALELACPRGFVRVFAYEGKPIAALLGQLAAAQRAGKAEASTVPAGCLARVLASFARRPSVPRQAASPGTGAGLAEPLTERELEVLGLLAAGRSNQRIARDLTVALDTAKKHVSHILGKLDAASRSEAVARAREIGLIP